VKVISSLVLLGLLATACGASGPPQATGPSQTPAGPSPAVRGGRAPGPFVPPPDARIPESAQPLARALATTTRALDSSIRRWTARGDPSRGSPPRDVQLRALYQQRIYGFLASRKTLAARTTAHLPAWLRPEARANLAAIRDILSLVHPVKHPAKVRVIPARPAGVLLRYYREAERRFHVSWTVLAAVNYIESKFGRVRSNSYAGAQGPMQFEPATWQAYGMGGDVHDPHDAILGAANYLHHSGAPSSYRDARYAYDPAGAYVDAVLIYANLMRRDPRAYYEYYDWQVFIRTRHGVRRLTGPGLG